MEHLPILREIAGSWVRFPHRTAAMIVELLLKAKPVTG